MDDEALTGALAERLLIACPHVWWVISTDGERGRFHVQAFWEMYGQDIEWDAHITVELARATPLDDLVPLIIGPFEEAESELHDSHATWASHR
jgi:hypothetical protein